MAPAVDTEWFTERLRDRGLSQRGLAKLMNIDPAAVSLTFRGKRKLNLEEAAQLAVLLNVSTTDVLARAGMQLHGEPKRHLIGRLTNNFEVIMYGEGAHDQVDALPGLPSDCEAVQARTAGTDQEQIDGWLYFVSGTKGNATKVLGELAMAAVKGDGIKIAHVKKGYLRGTYNLLTPKGEMITNAEIAWATPVLWIKTQI